MIKERLKRIPIFENINRAVKSVTVASRYRATRRYYEARAKPIPHTALLDGRITAWPARRSLLTERPRLFLLGTDEQQDRGGMLQALGLLSDLRWFTRADGSYGQNDPSPPVQRVANNTRRLHDQLETLSSAGWTADLLIAQTWASTIEPGALSEVRERWGTFIINIAMDDRHQYWGRKLGGHWDGTYPFIPHLDLTLTAAPECVEWYEKEGCPALYFPEASDPDIFRPMPELPKVHDVCFVGGCYGIRGEIVTALRRAGVKVAAYGSGWEGGRIATEDVPRLFAQSRIVLGVGTIGHCRDFYALKMRDFDGPMSGSLYATHDNSDLHTLFEPGREIVLFRNTADCVEKVRHYLAYDAERDAIAAAGRTRAARDHTWHSRFGRLISLLQGRENRIVDAAGTPE